MFRVASATAAARRNATHWQQYLFLAIGYFVVQYTDHAKPFQRVIYRITDAELWRYSYPLVENHVPAWVVPLLALLTPVTVVSGFYAAGRIPRLAAHHAVVQGWAAVVITGLITNLVKLNVGRPRPDFAARCWPNGGVEAAAFSHDGVALCSGPEADWIEGLKSFPSGHTAWSVSGLGYTSLWLVGALRCFDGAARPTRLATALVPACIAVWIGMTRLQDYWHHTEDVLAGAALGTVVAWLCYRTVHCPLMGPAAGQLLLLAEGGGAVGGAATSADLGLGNGVSPAVGLLQGSSTRYSGSQASAGTATMGDEVV